MKKSLEWIPSGAAAILLVLAPDNASNAWGALSLSLSLSNMLALPA